MRFSRSAVVILLLSLSFGTSAYAQSLNIKDVEELEKQINLIVDGNEAAVRSLVYRAYAEPRILGSTTTTVTVLEAPAMVGKTFLAHTFAKLAFPGKQAFDLRSAELNDIFSLNRLIGTPVGYAYDYEGALVTWLRDPRGGKDGGVLIIDEPGKLTHAISKELQLLIGDEKLKINRPKLGDDGKPTDGSILEADGSYSLPAPGLTVIITKRPDEALPEELGNRGGQPIAVAISCKSRLSQISTLE